MYLCINYLKYMNFCILCFIQLCIYILTLNYNIQP